jgi:hypothetical protein
MSETPRDYEAELWATMGALGESLAEAPNEDVLQGARDTGEDPRAIADRVRNVLRHAVRNHEERQLSKLNFQHTKGLASEAESDIVATLELAFASKSLRQLCESEEKATRDLGGRVAQKLRRRLADLRAATSVNDLVAGRPRELEGAPHRNLAVNLSESSRIVFCANHNTIPLLPSGRVDWSRVSRVKILRIETADA